MYKYKYGKILATSWLIGIICIWSIQADNYISADVGILQKVLNDNVQLYGNLNIDRLNVSDKFYKSLNIERLNDNTKLDASLNNFLDQVFQNLRVSGKQMGLEPLNLPNLTKQIDHKIWFLTMDWIFSLSNGILTNLTALQRAGDVILSYENKVLQIDALFEFPELQVEYDFKTQLNHLGPKGKLYGKIESLFVHFALEVNTEMVHVKLTHFEFPKCGEVQFKIDVNYIFDIFVNTFSNIITGLFKEPILLLVQHEIRINVQKMFDNFLGSKFYIA